jgi:hypothetical protein
MSYITARGRFNTAIDPASISHPPASSSAIRSSPWLVSPAPASPAISSGARAIRRFYGSATASGCTTGGTNWSACEGGGANRASAAPLSNYMLLRQPRSMGSATLSSICASRGA